MSWPKFRQRTERTRCSKRDHDLTLPGAIRLSYKKGSNGRYYPVRACVECQRFSDRKHKRNMRGGLKERFISDFDDGSFGLKFHGKPCTRCQNTLRYWKSECCVRCQCANRKARWQAEKNRANQTQPEEMADAR